MVDVIDTSLHTTSIPTGYTGLATVVGNALTAAGVAEMASVFFTSTGAATDVLLGFRPTAVKVVNSTDSITWEWIRGMAVANSLKTVLSGPTLTLDTGSAINPTEPAGTGGGGNWKLTLSATLCGTSKAISVIVFG
jgi:hypothetical protein